MWDELCVITELTNHGKCGQNQNGKEVNLKREKVLCQDLHLLVHLSVDVNGEESLAVDYQCVGDDVKTCLWMTQKARPPLMAHPSADFPVQALAVNQCWYVWYVWYVNQCWYVWEQVWKEPGWTTALIISLSPHSWVTCVDHTGASGLWINYVYWYWCEWSLMVEISLTTSNSILAPSSTWRFTYVLLQSLCD